MSLPSARDAHVLGCDLLAHGEATWVAPTAEALADARSGVDAFGSYPAFMARVQHAREAAWTERAAERVVLASVQGQLTHEEAVTLLRVLGVASVTVSFRGIRVDDRGRSGAPPPPPPTGGSPDADGLPRGARRLVAFFGHVRPSVEPARRLDRIVRTIAAQERFVLDEAIALGRGSGWAEETRAAARRLDALYDARARLVRRPRTSLRFFTSEILRRRHDAKRPPPRISPPAVGRG